MASFKAYGNPGKREGERDISNLDATYQTILDGSGNKRVVYGSGITTATMWEAPDDAKMENLQLIIQPRMLAV